MAESEKPKTEFVQYVDVPINQETSGCTKIILRGLTLIGVLGLIVCGGITIFVVSGMLTLNSIFASIGNLLGEPPTAQVTSTRTIVRGLQPLGQLVSISVEVAQADIGVSVNSGGLNLCGHSANHVSQGVIEAGIDITKVVEDSVQYDNDSDTYTLILPPPSITSCRIEYIRQYERSGGNLTCGIDWDTVRVLAQHESMSLFTADTIEGGILTRAERETTLLMESFVSALTGSEVDITYSEADTQIELPPSCQPQIPRGWEFDEELNEWVKTG
jgi:hypothetical protein